MRREKGFDRSAGDRETVSTLLDSVEVLVARVGSGRVRRCPGTR
jgi:hypothetical protein